jgi:predicted transcriptional regulator of viral defense system
MILRLIEIGGGPRGKVITHLVLHATPEGHVFIAKGLTARQLGVGEMTMYRVLQSLQQAGLCTMVRPGVYRVASILAAHLPKPSDN